MQGAGRKPGNLAGCQREGLKAEVEGPEQGRGRQGLWGESVRKTSSGGLISRSPCMEENSSPGLKLCSGPGSLSNFQRVLWNSTCPLSEVGGLSANLSHLPPSAHLYVIFSSSDTDLPGLQLNLSLRTFACAATLYLASPHQLFPETPSPFP